MGAGPGRAGPERRPAGDPGTVLDVVARFRGGDGGRLPPDVAAVGCSTSCGRRSPSTASSPSRPWRFTSIPKRAARPPSTTVTWRCSSRRCAASIPSSPGRRPGDGAFQWRGHRFGPGDWVLLDLYGTNHDARTWKDPGRFDPERFVGWDGGPFNFIPRAAAASGSTTAARGVDHDRADQAGGADAHRGDALRRAAPGPGGAAVAHAHHA